MTKRILSVVLAIILTVACLFATPVSAAKDKETLYVEPTTTYTCDFEDNYISSGLIADKNSPNARCTRGEILQVNGNKFLNFYADNNSENFRFEIFNSADGSFQIKQDAVYTVTVKYKVSNIAKSVITQEKTYLQLVRFDGSSEGTVISALTNNTYAGGETSDWITTSMSFKADLTENSGDTVLAIKLVSPTCPTNTTEKENLITSVYFDDIVVKEYPTTVKVITFETNSSVGVDPIVAEPGTAITLPTPTRDMYNFGGWYTGDAYISKSEITEMPTGNTKLYAKWEPVSNVTVLEFDAKGGDCITQLVGKAGDSVLLPTPVRDGFRFAGWVDETGAKWNQTTTFPSKNTKLTATYEYKELVLNFEDKEHYDSLPDSILSFRFTVVNEQSNFGTYALKYDTEHGWNPSNYKGEAGAALFDTNGERIRLKNGTKYKISYYLKIVNVADKTYRCYRDGKDTYGLITVVTSSAGGRWANWSDQDFYDKYTPDDISNNWVKVEREFVAHSNSEDANYLSLAISGYSVLYIDDLKLWEVDDSIEQKEGYSLTFETDNGNWIDTVYGNTNEEFAMPEDPVREGYTFKGWYSDITLETPFTQTKFADANIVAYAAWEKNPETNKPTGNGGALQGGDAQNSGIVIYVVVAAVVVVIAVAVVVIIAKKKKA